VSYIYSTKIVIPTIIQAYIDDVRVFEDDVRVVNKDVNIRVYVHVGVKVLREHIQ
jgi:hypothetical protein